MGVNNKTTESLPTMGEDVTGTTFESGLNEGSISSDSIQIEHEQLFNLSRKFHQEISNNESKIEDYQDLSVDMVSDLYQRKEIDLLKRNDELKKGLSLIDQQHINLENIEYLNNEIKDNNPEAKIMLTDILKDKERISVELKKL